MTTTNSVLSIGISVFYCSKFMSINVNGVSQDYASSNSVLFNKGKTALIQFLGGKEGDYTIPDSVASIGYYAFGRFCIWRLYHSQ